MAFGTAAIRICTPFFLSKRAAGNTNTISHNEAKSFPGSTEGTSEMQNNTFLPVIFTSFSLDYE